MSPRAKANHVNPEAYLADVLLRVQTTRPGAKSTSCYRTTGAGLSRGSRTRPQSIGYREAALRLRVSPVTVHRLCAEGNLPHGRVSNALRINCADVEVSASDKQTLKWQFLKKGRQ